MRPSKDDVGAAATAAVRRLELEFKLNLPRLVEGMEDKVVAQGAIKGPMVRGVVVTAQAVLGQQGRNNQATILTPFRCGEESLRPAADQNAVSTACTAEHPLLRARAWQKLLRQNPKLSLRRLAAREGEVAPTLVRHFKLLKLAPAIRRFLARQCDPKAIHFFSQRRLAPLAGLNEARQLELFRQMQVEFGLFATKVPGRSSVAIRSEDCPARNVMRLF